jgi:hypothetical protein
MLASSAPMNGDVAEILASAQDCSSQKTAITGRVADCFLG